MSLDVLKGNFQAGFNAFLPVVSESFEQIFFQPLSATLEILPDSKILKKIRNFCFYTTYAMLPGRRCILQSKEVFFISAGFYKEPEGRSIFRQG